MGCGAFNPGRGYLKVERYVSGVLLVGLGMTTALAGDHKTQPEYDAARCEDEAAPTKRSIAKAPPEGRRTANRDRRSQLKSLPQGRMNLPG
jgi:hypothetical protein